MLAIHEAATVGGGSGALLPAPVAVEAADVGALASAGGDQMGVELCVALPDDNSEVVSVSMEDPVGLVMAGTEFTPTAVAPESGLISVDDVIAFGGFPNPMGPDRRASQQVQSQPDVDDLQIGRAMRMAKMKEVQNSTGMNFNTEHSILHFTPQEILDKATAVG